MAPMRDFYADKCLFITGSTGFVAKVILEKVLRSLPTVRRIYLLIRPLGGVTPEKRLAALCESPIFERLRGELGGDTAFRALVTEKLRAVGGDVTMPGLGLVPDSAVDTPTEFEAKSTLLAELEAEVQLLVHSAATIDFDSPLDTSIKMNCLGGLEVMGFARRLRALQAFVHISTAYVNSDKKHTAEIHERLYPLPFDVDDVIERSGTRPGGRKASAAAIEKLTVNAIGTFPNTYTLTKAMTEHLMAREAQRHGVPLLILRPSIVGASWREPVPGWVDNVSAAGAVFLSNGVGLVKFMPGNSRGLADIVPVDTVAHHTLLALRYMALRGPGHGSGDAATPIMHCCTSTSANPLPWRVVIKEVVGYWHRHPPQEYVSKPDGRFQMMTSHQNFQLQWWLRYTAPSSIYSTFANLLGSEKHVAQAARLKRFVERAGHVVTLFKPFTENSWRFHTESHMTLLMDASLTAEDLAEFDIDISHVVWPRYLGNFCYGLRRWVLHEDVVPIAQAQVMPPTNMALSTNRLVHWDADHHKISFPSLFQDMTWAYTSSRRPGYTSKGILGRLMGVTGWREGMNHEAEYVPRPLPEPVDSLTDALLAVPAVRTVIEAEAREQGLGIAAVRARAREIVRRMAATQQLSQARRVAWMMRKVWRSIYEGVRVDEQGLEVVRAATKRAFGENEPSDGSNGGTCRAPVVLLPNHRSYIDFIILSYIMFAYNLPLPHIAAGEDFMAMGPVTDVLRKCGAFFIRRTFGSDKLYAALVKEYMQRMMLRGHVLEFFIEGTRSRSGKQLEPKMGLLANVVEPVLDGRLQDALLVPVTMDYEKALEVSLYSSELLGESKIKESMVSLLKSSKILGHNFGTISVQFGEPVSVREYLLKHDRRAALTRGGQSHLTLRELAYDISASQMRAAVFMPTHLVAALLLTYRNGISRAQLVQRCEWLRAEVVRRGGHVACAEGETREAVLQRALSFLGPLVIVGGVVQANGASDGPRKKALAAPRLNIVEPNIAERSQYPNMLSLGFYRNKLLFLFCDEAMMAVALFACQHEATRRAAGADISPPASTSAAAIATARNPAAGTVFTEPVGAPADTSKTGDVVVHARTQDVLDRAVFLRRMLQREFVLPPAPASATKDVREQDMQNEHVVKAMRGTLAQMIDRGVLLTSSSGCLEVSPDTQGELTHSLLCTLLWPFVDSYWVAAIALFALTSNTEVEEATLLERMQWLAETMYHERMICFYESCSRETLRHALDVFYDWGVVCAARSSKMQETSKRTVIRLQPPYTDATQLRMLTTRLGALRKPAPAVVASTIPSVAELPMLAKL